MADKNTPDQSEDEEAIKKVDAMMSLSETDGTPAVATSVDISKFEKKTKSAPKLPGVYKPKEPVKPPIVIKLADASAPAPKATEATPPHATETPAKPEEPAEEPVPNSEPGGSTDIENSDTDKAVDDIAAKESDTVLAVEDARKAKKEKAVVGKGGPRFKTRLKNFFKSKWTWIGLAVVLLAVLALPPVRYTVLGLFIKKPVTVTVLDSKSHTPVSQAEVTLDGQSAKTDADGKVSFSARVGQQHLSIDKQYYQELSTTYFVGLKKPPPKQVQLVATGRLVPITVVDRISGKPLADAQIKILNTSARTNKDGKATIVLPAKLSVADYTASLSGYLNNQGAVMVTDKVVSTNTISLLAAGHVYFLSNRSGTIDVVKSNLDGSDRKTVLAGTGHEDPSSTSLLASRDWRYLVLKSRRSGNNDTLSLIDTSTDKVSSFDTSDSSFQLVGWYGHNFIYDLTKNNQPLGQAGREQLKSYDADHQQLNQLDQNQANGASDTPAYQSFSNFYILNGVVVYTTQWIGAASGASLNGESFTIRAVQPNGQNKKDYETFAASATSYIQAALYSPQAVYFAVYNDKGQPTYYDFENQSAKAVSLDSGAFSQNYPTYLLSPSGNQTFWTELRDGKNALFLGNDAAGNQRQIAGDTDYSPYGWYSDKYVLVSKDDSELYIMAADGLFANQPPLKITDYYKPAQTFNGYGYGGL